MYTNIELEAEQAAVALQAHSLKLVTAESCTGGWVAQAITSIAGSTAWFERGFVTYSNEAKQECLGVQAQTLEQYGAVSEQCVLEMAKGALQHSHAHISLAITGVAGPGGGTADKPVGLVWFAWAFKEGNCKAMHQNFAGDRTTVRTQAVGFALRELCVIINSF